jgi:hypothetical protein
VFFQSFPRKSILQTTPNYYDISPLKHRAHLQLSSYLMLWSCGLCYCADLALYVVFDSEHEERIFVQQHDIRLQYCSVPQPKRQAEHSVNSHHHNSFTAFPLKRYKFLVLFKKIIHIYSENRMLCINTANSKFKIYCQSRWYTSLPICFEGLTTYPPQTTP